MLKIPEIARIKKELEKEMKNLAESRDRLNDLRDEILEFEELADDVMEELSFAIEKLSGLV